MGWIGNVGGLADAVSKFCVSDHSQQRHLAKELEPFRKSARTIDAGTGVQQHIYEVPIKDREIFEKLWPVVVKVRTPGGRLTLFRPESAAHKHWGSLLSHKKPVIRIHGPSGGISVLPSLNLDVGKSIGQANLSRTRCV
ncbi:MAG: hypothetical protein CMJ78_09880 [Planctomycetaceae bacterium]|nr:hypothetical protein [Planctomycetaceae bacterium]